ncbi:MAG: hypothetical protein IIW61_03400 [Bacteroidaceae bacterium]|nr:hypothetical protein [Bacteroidaceae bacterium]
MHIDGKDSARRVEYKTKCKAFVFIPEPQPILGEAKVVQGEWNTKQNAKLLFLFPSRSLSWAKPK